jgi:hypothetical protein
MGSNYPPATLRASEKESNVARHEDVPSGRDSVANDFSNASREFKHAAYGKHSVGSADICRPVLQRSSFWRKWETKLTR